MNKSYLIWFIFNDSTKDIRINVCAPNPVHAILLAPVRMLELKLTPDLTECIRVTLILEKLP